MEKFLINTIAELSDSKCDLLITPKDVSVRRWPYPYLAGLTISNDAEFMSEELIEELLKYANSSLETAFGTGLNLQMSSSLFFYSASTCSIFSGLEVNAPETRWADRAAQLIQAGLLDTNHAFGEFDDAPSFVRAHAERSYSWMSKRGVTLPCFSNHGGTNNRQNIGTDAEYHEGDRRSSSAYHADLLQSNGVKFVWTDSKSYELLPLPSTPKLLSEAPSSLFSRYARVRSPAEVATTAFDVKRDPRSVEESVLRDDSKIHTFTRFRGTGANAPNVSSFYSQVRRAVTSGLYSRQGAIILYQHFGVLFREAGQCVPTTVHSLVENPAGFFPAWRILEREAHEGRLWIPTLHRFLRYARAIESISVRHDENGQLTLTSSDLGLEPDDLDGMTFYVSPATPTTVSFKGHLLSIQRNGPDETGSYSVTVAEKGSRAIWN